MTIINPTGKDAIKTSCSTRELSEALQALHLENIHPKLRKLVILARIGEIILNRTTDPVQRMKPSFEAVEHTYWQRKLGHRA